MKSSDDRTATEFSTSAASAVTVFFFRLVTSGPETSIVPACACTPSCHKGLKPIQRVLLTSRLQGPMFI